MKDTNVTSTENYQYLIIRNGEFMKFIKESKISPTQYKFNENVCKSYSANSLILVYLNKKTFVRVFYFRCMCYSGKVNLELELSL